MNTRSLVRIACLSLVVVAAGSWRLYNNAEGQAVDVPRLAAQAENAFKLQSYNQAIQRARGYLEAAPQGEKADAMRRLIGLCEVGLKQWNDGAATLSDLIKRQPRFERDAEVLDALANASLEANRNDARNWVDKAVAQHAAAGNVRQPIQLLFKLAEKLSQGYWYVDIPREGGQAEIVRRVALTLKTYDRILGMNNAETGELIRAMAGKADVMRRYGHNLLRIPEEQWPAGVDVKYPLAKPFELAIRFERDIVRRFASHPEAPKALLRIGNLQENQLNDYVAAVKTYEEIRENYARSPEARQALAHITGIKAPSVSLNVTGPALPGEKPKYAWNARNTKTIEFAAYPVDLFELLRKVENFSELDKFMTESLRKAVQWTVETGDAGDHQFLSSSSDDRTKRRSGPRPTDEDGLIEAPLDESNAYLVVASATNAEGKRTSERTVMIVSRLAAMRKNSPRGELVFAAAADSGQPLAQVDALIQLRSNDRRGRTDYRYVTKTVPDNGLLEIESPKPADNEQLFFENTILLRQGSDYAVLGEGRWFGRWHGRNEGIRVYAYADRPVYRPEQTVNFKHVLRKYEDGVYHVLADKDVALVINDSRGQKVHEETLKTNRFGSISGSFTLGEEPALGMCSMQLTIDGQGVEMGPGSAFRVEEYKKPEYEVTIQPDEDAYQIGQKVRVKVHGEYYFGGPVANAEVTYTVKRNTYFHDPIGPIPYGWFYDEPVDVGVPYGWRIWPPRPYRSDLAARGTVTTDENGDAFIEFESKPFENVSEHDLQYVIEANMVDQSRREIRASAAVKVTHQAFYIGLKPVKNLYRPADRARVEVRADNPNGKPVAFEGKAAVSLVTQREQRDESGKIVQEQQLEQVSEEPFTVDATGKGVLEFVPEKKGLYRVDVSAPDPFDGKVEGSAYVWIAEGRGEFARYAFRDLELVADKTTLLAGENLTLLVNTKHEGAYVLLTAESDGVYHKQIVFVPETSATVEIPVEKSWQPNVTLRAAALRDGKIFQEELAVQTPPTEDFLTVTIRAPKDEFLPREEAEIEVRVADHQGRPVECELSLGAIDSSVFYIQNETRGDVRKFFHGRVRPDMVHTTTSYGFTSDGRRVRLMSGEGMRMGGGMGGMPSRSGRAIGDAMEMSAMAPAAEAAVDKAMPEEPTFAEAEVRSEFPDTVYWAAHLKTSADGLAKATIKFPDSLTTWRLTAIAADHETKVGEVKHEVVTRKNIIVRLQSPRFFVERDTVVLSAIAHNYLDAEQTVRVKMDVGPQLALLGVAADGDSVSDENPTQERYVDIQVPAGGEKRVDFFASANSPGKAEITASALTENESDAMKLEFDVLEYGAEKLLAESGVMFGLGGSRDEVSVSLDIPEQIREGSQSLTVRLSPTVAGVMLQSLPYLLDYPYGCTEQTMSRFLPAVLTARTLRRLGVDLAALEELPADPTVQQRLERFRSAPVYDANEMQKMVDAGVARLTDFQKDDGGWGWWKQDQSNPYITAYVVSGLALADKSGVVLPEGMLRRGVDFLANAVVQSRPITRYPWQQAENASVRAYMLFAIAEADAKRLAQPDIRQQIDRVFNGRDELTDYSRALLALVLHAARLNEQAGIVLDNIKDRAKIDKQTESASWGDYSGYYYWYHAGTEATSFSLRALLAIEPQDPMIPQVVSWLLRHRRGTRWFNTKDTANVCYALAEYLQVSKELQPDMTVAVEVDGKEVKTVRFTQDNVLSGDADLVLGPDVLGTGAKKVTVRREGDGNLYWGAYATFFTKEDRIEAAGNELYVERQYFRLEPKEVEKTRTVFDPQTRKRIEETYTALEYESHPLKEGEELESGQLIDVALKITAKNNFEYLVFEDPKPAGCEPIDLQSGARWAGGFGAHMELRDEKVAFFATYLNQGEHEIRYRMRAEIPGAFHALPSQAECMYAPFVRGNAASRVVRIVHAP